MPEVCRFYMCIRDQSTARGVCESIHGANTIASVADFIQTCLHFDSSKMLVVKPYLERLDYKNRCFHAASRRIPDLCIIVYPHQTASWMFLDRVKWILN